MKKFIDVLVVLGSLIFGLALFNWVFNFTPSFIRREETEIVIEDDNIDWHNDRVDHYIYNVYTITYCVCLHRS